MHVPRHGCPSAVLRPVFSGAGKDRNNPNSTDKANAGPLPKGTYYIVDGDLKASGGNVYCNCGAPGQEWNGLPMGG